MLGMLREVREQGRQLGERLDLMERRLAEREVRDAPRYVMANHVKRSR